MSRTRILRFLGLLSAISAVSAVNPPRLHAAEPPIIIEDVTIGLAEQPSSGLFKIGTWTPIWINLKGGPTRFVGTIGETTTRESRTRCRRRALS